MQLVGTSLSSVLPRCQSISLGQGWRGIEQLVPSGELVSLMGKLHDLDIPKTSLAMVQVFKHTARGLGPNTDSTGLQLPIPHLILLLPLDNHNRGTGDQSADSTHRVPGQSLVFKAEIPSECY